MGNWEVGFTGKRQLVVILADKSRKRPVFKIGLDVRVEFEHETVYFSDGRSKI